jgi:hypothetical protein
VITAVQPSPSDVTSTVECCNRRHNLPNTHQRYCARTIRELSQIIVAINSCYIYRLYKNAEIAFQFLKLEEKVDFVHTCIPRICGCHGETGSSRFSSPPPTWQTEVPVAAEYQSDPRVACGVQLHITREVSVGDQPVINRIGIK